MQWTALSHSRFIHTEKQLVGLKSLYHQVGIAVQRRDVKDSIESARRSIIVNVAERKMAIFLGKILKRTRLRSRERSL
jgi:hypothetical protein